MSTRELTCIGCPLGCALTVTMDGDTVTAVIGNTCPRGDAYARKEVTNPTRIVTSTVRVRGGGFPMANGEVKIGDVILPNVAGTGVDIVAARNVAAC